MPLSIDIRWWATQEERGELKQGFGGLGAQFKDRLACRVLTCSVAHHQFIQHTHNTHPRKEQILAPSIGIAHRRVPWLRESGALPISWFGEMASHTVCAIVSIKT
jgi:hypothetical protein